MKIPKKIKVGGIIYQIKTKQKFDDDRQGDLDWDKATIRIKDGMNKQTEQMTFIHEVLHAIDFAYLNGKIKDNFGEDGIDVIANGIYQIIPQVEG